GDIGLDRFGAARLRTAEAAAARQFENETVARRHDMIALVLELGSAAERGAASASGASALASLRGIVDAIESRRRDDEGGLFAIGDLDHLPEPAAEFTSAAGIGQVLLALEVERALRLGDL